VLRVSWSLASPACAVLPPAVAVRS
jgi:hypothetical protein